MQSDDCSSPLNPSAAHGVVLFNSGEYFEAHEALENAWREEQGTIRELYQGILQVAVTYLHIQHGNYEGAVKLSARARVKLEHFPDHCRGIDVESLRLDLKNVIENMTRLGPQRVTSFDQSLFKKIRINQ